MKFSKLAISLSFLIGTSALGACSDDDDLSQKILNQEEYQLTVASTKVPAVLDAGCGSTLLHDALAVKKNGATQWTAQGNISGFEAQPGTEYQIQVRETTFEDPQMGQRVWQEYDLVKVLSQETKASQDVPPHLIPKWYYEDGRYLPHYRFAVDATDKSVIEKDLRDNHPLMVKNHCMVYGEGLSNWIQLDMNGGFFDKGIIKREARKPADFPTSYQILPVKNVRSMQRWTFQTVESSSRLSETYDVFIARAATAGRDYDATPYHVFLYRDVTKEYQQKYPDAGVKAVVYSLELKLL